MNLNDHTTSGGDKKNLSKNIKKINQKNEKLQFGKKNPFYIREDKEINVKIKNHYSGFKINLSGNRLITTNDEEICD